MVARTRTRTANPVSGSVLYANGTSNTRVFNCLSENCKDTVGDMFDSNGNIKDHAFDLTRSRLSGGGLLNGIAKPGAVNQAIYTNYQGEQSTQTGSLMASGVSSSYTTRLLASTGPLTPKVNLPLFVFELKDIPMMLKHAGDLLHKIRAPSGLSPHKEAAAATLAYQFGWAPLISDLVKLTNFSEHVAKRQRELAKANTKKGLLRRMNFYEDQETVETASFLASTLTGSLIYASKTESRTRKGWGTVRWVIRDSQKIGRLPSHNEAFRSALGFNLGMIPITVWKALPWSWMVDWFADISNVMQANYNMIYYKPTSCCIMEHRTTKMDIKPIGNGGNITMSPVSNFIERKTRSLGSTSAAKVTLRLPFLDNFKLSILGSLAILGLSGRR